MADLKIWKHDELQNDLADHLRQSTDRIVWTNIQMGPSGTYRPDVFCIPKSFAHFHPVVYEIKVSLSDFRSDVTSGKWQNYLKVAQAVIFAMPAGFINKQDVPATCGLIIRYENGWKMVKKPTMHALDTLPRDAWIKLLIDGIERERNRKTQEYINQTIDKYKAQKAISKKYGEEIGKLLYDRDSAAERLKHAITYSEYEIEQVRKRRQESIERINASDAEYSELKKELCQLVGVEPSVSVWVLTNKIRGLINSLNKEDEIVRLNKLIINIKSAVDNALTTDIKFDNFAQEIEKKDGTNG